MKRFNKQILEAINRGILLALDDYQDTENNNSISHYNDVIDSKDVIKLRIELDRYTVDLGLPSGTLWCKYNLGCDYNLLNNHLEDIKPENLYGDYYAWGETEPNKPYVSGITKYNNKDNLILLLPEDDAAYLNMDVKNFKFHIPTKELCDELIKYTNGHWEKNYQNIEGLNGWLIRGKNGNELFLPASGYYSYHFNKFHNVGFFGNYFTSTLYLEDNYYLRNRNEVYTLVCGGITSDGYSIQLKHDHRNDGYRIRPVLNKYSLHESSLNLSLDDFDFNDNEESNNTNDIINTNDLIIANLIVKLINNIELKNTIHIDPSIKRLIRKLYKHLKNNLNDEKYIITTREKLKELIRHIVIINPKEDLNWIDTSHITSMYAMFDDFFSKNFYGDVSEWDMHNVTNTRNMFYGCEKFNCDISKWNMSNVKVMGNMFSECYKFNQDLSKWDVSNVSEMSGLFSGCHNFNYDLSKWDVSNVTDMAWMFSRCEKFNLDLSKWDVSNVTRNNGFYYKAKFALTPEWVPNFDLNKTMGNA